MPTGPGAGYGSPGSGGYGGGPNAPAGAAAPQPPFAPSQVPGAAAIPFRRAAGPERTAISTTTSATALTGSQQSVIITLPGSGYLLWLDFFVQISASGTGNSAATTVAVFEDFPWASLASITLDAGGPQNVNIDGFSLYLANLYGGYYFRDPSLSSDTGVFARQAPNTTSTATAAGTANYHLRLPVAINNRNWWGLMGNQDRATKYNVRSDIAATGKLFQSAAPSVLPTQTISRAYGWAPVPAAVNADGRPQEQSPAHYGIVHYLTSVRNDALPASNSVVNHYLRNLSNAIRLFILIFRLGSGTAGSTTVTATSAMQRGSAEANLPTQIDFLIGSDVLRSESWQVRRQLMWDRYGFDAPAGVLVYDAVRDFSNQAGYELGDDYLYLGNVSEAQFRVTYPTYTASASNDSLTIVTDSLYIPDYIDPYSLSLSA